MAYIQPKRYQFENEEVLVDPRNNGVVATTPRRYTQPTAQPSVQPQGQVLGAFVDNKGNVTQPQPTDYNTALPTEALPTFEQFTQQRGGQIDENAIREQTRKNMQSQLDAINSYYADLVSREQQAGNARLDKVRALNINSGLSGSNFASSADLEQRGLNDKSVRAVENERNLKVQEVHGRIDEIARAEIAAKKAEAKGNADAYTEFVDKQRGDAKKMFTEMAGAGVDWNTLDQKRKSYLSKLLGYDEDTAALIYNSQKPKQAQIDYQYIKEAGAFVGVDPATGQLSQLKIEGAGPDADLILDIIKKYPDAGISLQDDIATATQKIQNSQLYQKDIRDDTSTQPKLVTVNGVQYEVDENGNYNLPNVPAAPADPKAVDKLQTIIDTATQLLNSPGGSSAIGPLQSKLPTFFGNTATFERTFEQLRGLLTLDNIGLLKGVLSDADMKIIKEASTKLSLSMSEDAFRAEVQNIINKAQAGLQKLQSGGAVNQNDPRVQELKQKFPDATEEELRAALGFNSVGKTSASTGGTPYLKTLGAITGIDGSPYWKHGLDIDLKKGDPVKSPVSGKVIAVGTNGGFGNQVKIQGDDGREYWLSHLDGYKVKKGDRVTAGTTIGLGGNTGKTIALGKGDGSHLDLTVKDQNGKYIPPRQVKQLLDNVFV